MSAPITWLIASAVILSGCGVSPSAPEDLVGTWQMDKITRKGREFAAVQKLRKDGTFWMQGTTVPIPGAPISFIVQGTWRADSRHLYQTATNSEPMLGFSLNNEEMNALVSVSASKYSVRTSLGELRTFRKMKTTAEPGGAANRSQPVESQTNRTSPAAGSGR